MRKAHLPIAVPAARQRRHAPHRAGPTAFRPRGTTDCFHHLLTQRFVILRRCFLLLAWRLVLEVRPQRIAGLKDSEVDRVRTTFLDAYRAVTGRDELQR